MKIRITELDRLFSLYIRTRDGWQCQRCFKQFTPPTNGLHCSHIFSRARKATRFALENCISWCYGCHSYMDRTPEAKYAWYIKKFGQTRFDRLRLRANIGGKPDYAMIRIWLNEALKQMGVYYE